MRRWVITNGLLSLLRRNQGSYKGQGARLLFNLTLICAGRNDRGPMVSPASVPTKIRFDSFELDVTSGELRKGRNRLRLQPQPFRVLLLLIERTGQVVAREEIQRCLWKDSTFVDFEHGINFCINQIRGALSDSAEKPRYIETVPRRGYRFIGTVEQPSPSKQDSPQEPTPPPIEAEPIAGRRPEGAGLPWQHLRSSLPRPQRGRTSSLAGRPF